MRPVCYDPGDKRKAPDRQSQPDASRFRDPSVARTLPVGKCRKGCPVPDADAFHFDGFASPTYTPVPDELFDRLMPHLSEAELKVLLYVVRRTFGFKKDADAISLKQMAEGITTRDGRVLDGGTGLSRPSVTKGVRGLIAKGILTADRHASAEKGDLPTTYRLRVRSTSEGGKESYEGEGAKLTTPLETILPPRRNQLAPQETVVQETVQQEDAGELMNDDDEAATDAPPDQEARVWTAAELLASEDAWQAHRRYVAGRLGGVPGPKRLHRRS